MTDLGRSSTMWRGVTLAVLALVTGGALTAFAVGHAPGAPLHGPTFARPVLSLAELERRLAAMDAAIAQGDLTRATYEWRGAYGVALGTRRWDAMAALGDAALRVDGLARRDPGGQTVFRAEARQAYMRTLFLARAARSVEGVTRAADAFGALGDTEMEVRVRTLLEARR